jgi:hypothetical protein
MRLPSTAGIPGSFAESTTIVAALAGAAAAQRKAPMKIAATAPGRWCEATADEQLELRDEPLRIPPWLLTLT